MRRHELFLVVIGVTVALVAAEGILRLVASDLPEMSRWPTVETAVKSGQIRNLPEEIEILLIGSSVTEAAVDPDLLSQLTGAGVVYNAAIPFATPTVHEIWLERVIFPHTRPSLLLIGLPVWPANDDGIDPMESGLLGATEESGLQRFLPWSSTARSEGVFAEWDRFRARERTASSGALTRLGHQTGHYGSVGGTIRGLFPPYGPPIMSPRQEAVLSSIVNRAKRDGIDVALLLEPGRYPGDVSPSTIVKYIGWVEEWARDQEVDLWNTYTIDWEDRLYADEAHFNREGTVQYTRYVARLVSAHLEAP